MSRELQMILESQLKGLVQVASVLRSRDPRDLKAITHVENLIDIQREKLWGIPAVPVPPQEERSRCASS